jgi:hypothetical protein
MTLPPEVKRAFHVATQLFREPGMVERVEELEFEACRLAGKRLTMVAALKFLAERGNKEAKGFLAALEYEHAKPAEDPHKELPKVKPGSIQ